MSIVDCTLYMYIKTLCFLVFLMETSKPTQSAQFFCMGLTFELVLSCHPAASFPAHVESLFPAADASHVPVPLAFVALPPDGPSPSLLPLLAPFKLSGERNVSLCFHKRLQNKLRIWGKLSRKNIFNKGKVNLIDKVS